MLDRLPIATLRRAVRFTGLGILAGLGLVGAGGRAAQAQPAQNPATSWEIGCAQSVVSPGSGDSLRVMNCLRQKDCQEIANRAGHTVFQAGCFGVAPSAPRLPAGAVRSNPQRQG
ncbi:MAG: hypothetical protein Q8S58_14305 [Bosea sp. (in: a-proteobacteria)]|uniref:hypothetical protein n=1 Tax=Bosea sp. (in: a-proteobacteria) TaxID=1871050 RepID=UPI0027369BE9|nr:hypothetical protein [Bosea sp. (in: a-proteobacteria)]MDP3256855.1 hypothetical protein [Bosea sp. (in: a-proteobacteria)]MDP3320293.1 hypothetical protein [Bosea sp. (in: a-proteobacteria)]